MVAIPCSELDREKKYEQVNVPERVARAEAEAECDGYIAPEALSESSSDGSDGHYCGCGTSRMWVRVSVV